MYVVNKQSKAIKTPAFNFYSNYNIPSIKWLMSSHVCITFSSRASTILTHKILKSCRSKTTDIASLKLNRLKIKLWRGEFDEPYFTLDKCQPRLSVNDVIHHTSFETIYTLRKCKRQQSKLGIFRIPLTPENFVSDLLILKWHNFAIND